MKKLTGDIYLTYLSSVKSNLFDQFYFNRHIPNRAIRNIPICYKNGITWQIEPSFNM